MGEAFGFLSVLGGAAPLTRRALPWFPVVGAVLGAVVGGGWWLTQQLWPAPVAAVLTVTLAAALTGLLHFDGLADAADGLLPHAERDRRLAIMRTPDVGAFGASVLVLVMLAQTVALSATNAQVLVVAALWVASRAVAAGVVATVPYARPDGGLATALIEGAPRWPGLAVLPAVAIATIGAGLAGFISVVVATAAGCAVVAFARHQLGGFTGDVLGAAIVVSETAGLVVLAARW